MEVTLPTKGNYEFKYLLDATAGRKNNFLHTPMVFVPNWWKKPKW